MLTNLLVIFLVTAGSFSLAPKWMQPSSDGQLQISAPPQNNTLFVAETTTEKRVDNDRPDTRDGKESVKSPGSSTVSANLDSNGSAGANLQSPSGMDLPLRSKTLTVDTSALAAEIAALKAKPELVRVMRARLKGSLCPACLIQLEKTLGGEPGIKYARVIRPAKNGGSVVYEPSYAQVEMVYLISRWNVKKLKRLVGRNDFGVRDEKDMPLTQDYRPMIDPI